MQPQGCTGLEGEALVDICQFASTLPKAHGYLAAPSTARRCGAFTCLFGPLAVRFLAMNVNLCTFAVLLTKSAPIPACQCS